MAIVEAIMSLKCHLHCHTDASKDGLGTTTRLVNAAASAGFKALAMTDHGTLANAISFTNACVSAGIKPIIGLEAYVQLDGRSAHLTLLAHGERGFSNLVKLNNLGHASSNKNPAFSIDELFTYSEDLICLSGCPASVFSVLPSAEAFTLGAKFKSVFGSRFFAEIMFPSESDFVLEYAARAIELSVRLNIHLVLTNDVHFPFAKDAVAHQTIMKARAGYSYDSTELWLKSYVHIPADLRSRFTSDAAIKSIYSVANRLGNQVQSINFVKTLSVERESGTTSSAASEKLAELAHDSLDAMVKRGTIYHHLPAYEDRLALELKTIFTMKQSSYFLNVARIVKRAKALGVKVGPGRGSGAGSLVLYLLKVTDVDPIRYKLSFERFLNPMRHGMPDVDIDFDSEGRPQLINALIAEMSAHPVATYSKYAHKSLVHDLSKELGISRRDEEVLVDLSPDSKEFKALASPKFQAIYNAAIGQIRHKSKHAGGIVISKADMPIERAGKDLVVAWTEGDADELSQVGITKFDLLGLSALSVLKRLEAKKGRVADRPNKTNEEVFSIFCQDRLTGIFQFSGSSGIRQYTINFRPESFEDLVMINALYRPGTLDVGISDKVIEWRQTGERRHVHPEVDEILKSTYSAVVFQEQVMEVYRWATGGTLAEADLARRVIVKGDLRDEIDSLGEKFIEGCKAHGMATEDARSFWDELASHARYSFNRAHAVCYALIAWQMAWWKYYYPADFYAELLNVDSSEAQSYLVAAAADGIYIMPPHINLSEIEYTTHRFAEGRTALVMPFTAIKYLSYVGAEAIVKARDLQSSKKFLSTEDFMKSVPKRAVTARAREGLYMLGAFPWIDTRLYTSPSTKVVKTTKSISSLLSELELKPELELQTLSRFETMVKYLGAVLLTPKEVANLKAASAGNIVAGVVASVETRVSSYGSYQVYRLIPDASFWARKLPLMAVGDLVVVKLGENGKALTIKKTMGTI